MTDRTENTATSRRLLVAFASAFKPASSYVPAESRRSRAVQAGKPPFASIAVVLAGTALLLASPSVGTAQAPLPECMHCEFSPFGEWPSTICVFDYSGWNECAQVGRSHDHDFNPSGGSCGDLSASAATDEEAVRMVTRDERLPADGNYFFVVDEGYKAVMRKCDNSVVARVSPTNAIVAVVRQSDGRFIRRPLVT